MPDNGPLPYDEAQRLLVDEFWIGATDAEIAEVSGANIPTVRRARADLKVTAELFPLFERARQMDVVAEVGRTHAIRAGWKGTVSEFLIAAAKEFGQATEPSIGSGASHGDDVTGNRDVALKATDRLRPG